MRHRALTSALSLAAASMLALPAAPAQAVSAPVTAAPAPAAPTAPTADTASVERSVGFSAPAPPAATRPSAGAGRTPSPGASESSVIDVPSDVAVVGATWDAGVAGDRTRVEFRTRSAGTWGPWEEGPEADCPTCVAAQEAARRAGTARDGSDAIVVTNASQVQARIVGSGAAPAHARLLVIDPDAIPAPAGAQAPAAGRGRFSAAGASSRSGSRSSLPAMPALQTRAAWGATSHATPARLRVRGFAVHHTAGSNDYTRQQVPAILRGIQRFHTSGRGWSDIGYNVLVDKYGRIWEGRPGGFRAATRGAHAVGFNSELLGISILGDYNAADVSPAAVSAVSRVIGYVSAANDLDPTGTVVLHDGRRHPVVSGHRDVGTTSCPGAAVARKLPLIRAKAANYR